MMCVCGSLRGGERQRRSELEAAAEVAGPGGATAAGKPRRPETEGRRLRGHSLRYLPAGKEDKEAVGTQPAQARRYHQRRSPTHRCVVVKTDVRTSSVSRSLHQLTLLRAVRWAWVGSQGGGGREVGGGGSEGQEGSRRRGRRGQDTVCLLLQQPARLTLAAQRLLGHHEQKVGVGQSLRVEQPRGTTGGRSLGGSPRPGAIAPPMPSTDHASLIRPAPRSASTCCSFRSR